MRNTFRALGLSFALAAGLGLAACGSFQDVAGGVIDMATGLSQAGPSDVTTYKDATLVADAATLTIGWLADNAETFHINLATLQQLNAINEAMHDAWLKLKAAHDGGQSLNFAAFNAALTAYQTYKAESAMPNPPASLVKPATTSMLTPTQRYAMDFDGSGFSLRLAPIRLTQIAIR